MLFVIKMEKKLQIPDNVRINMNSHTLNIVGPKGTNIRKIGFPNLSLSLSNNEILLYTKKNSRNEKRLIETISSHIRNMIYGTINGYTAKLKVCSGHFPIKVTIENKKVVISNFLGEKIPRKADIIDGVSAKIENDIIIVEGIDKEKTMQTAANIERATRITNRDRRIFQDGCYIIK